MYKNQNREILGILGSKNIQLLLWQRQDRISLQISKIFGRYDPSGSTTLEEENRA
jgi:hypothetical protein